MNDRFLFRAFYQGRFIYKNLIDANYYTYDNKCIGLANTLPNSLKWEQCTGLKDKNGKLIYEGDILKNGIHYYQVIWHAGKFVLNTGCKNYPISGCDLAEIVGNIHENGDLLR